MAYKSAYKFIYKTLNLGLKRTGVFVNSTAGYPRVEVHSFVENQALDKGAAVRVISCIVESMSTTSLENAVEMNEKNIELIQAIGQVSGAAFKIVGFIPTTLQDLVEQTDTQSILYRQLQSYDIYLEQQ